MKLNELQNTNLDYTARIVILDQLGWIITISIFILTDHPNNQNKSNEWLSSTIPKFINLFSVQHEKNEKLENNPKKDLNHSDPIISLISSIFNVIHFENECLTNRRVKFILFF